MLRGYTTILTAVFALVTPLTCAAAGVSFDRNGNGIDDIFFSGDQSTRPFVLFDNDEDGKNDFGFVSQIVVGTDTDVYGIVALWIDKNGDGEMKKNELHDLPRSLPWATFPQTYALSSTSNSDGSITHFMDYTDDAVIAQEIGRDLDADGDLERDIFLGIGAIGEGASDTLAFIDRNNDGFFDTYEQGTNVLVRLPRALWRHLPALDDYHFPL